MTWTIIRVPLSHNVLHINNHFFKQAQPYFHDSHLSQIRLYVVWDTERPFYLQIIKKFFKIRSIFGAVNNVVARLRWYFAAFNNARVILNAKAWRWYLPHGVSYYFLVHCPHYKEESVKMLLSNIIVYEEELFNCNTIFKRLMSSTNERNIFSICRFIQLCFKRRDEQIQFNSFIYYSKV